MSQQDLVDYYNRNTNKFIFFQKDKGNRNIHQALWGDEHFTPARAINYSNELIVDKIDNYALRTKEQALKIADLGCGVGTSVFYLLDHLKSKATLFGISISSAQIHLALQSAAKLGLNGRCEFIESDFHNLPDKIPNVDIAYSIEAFVHSKHPQRYFQEVAKKLKRNGELILIDDFLHDRFNQDKIAGEDLKIVNNFKYGWVLGNLNTTEEIAEKALENGLRLKREKDLTPLLKYRLRDRIIRFFMLFVRDRTKSEYLKSLIGGNARQLCIQKELIQYKMLVFEKE